MQTHLTPPSENHSQTPPLMLKRRRTETGMIDDPVKRRVTFSKRRGGLFKKASDLCTLTGARIAIIVFSITGKVYPFSSPNVEEIISDYLGCDGDVMPPKGLREWVDWVEKECNSCATEDFSSLIDKCEAVLDRARKKLKESENNPPVKAGAGDDSGVGVGRDYEVSHDDDKIHSLSESFEAPCPSRLAPFEDLAGDGDRGDFLTLPVNSATEEDFDSLIGEDVGAGGDSGVGVCCDSEVLKDDEIHSLSESFEAPCPSHLAPFEDLAGDRGGFLTSPVNSATEEDFDSLIVDDVGAGGDSGAGVCCDSEVLNDDEIDSLLQNLKASRPSLFALFKDSVRHGDCDSFLTSPVNLAAGGGSSGVESTPVRSVLEGCAYNGASGGSLGVKSIPTCADLEGCGFNPDDFLNLSEDCIADGDSSGFLTLPENSAVGGGSTGEEATHHDVKACGYNPDDFAALEDLDVSWDKYEYMRCFS